MATKLIANYSKRLGLPGYSSHQFSVTVETEITSIDSVADESTRLYRTLQGSVDQEIQQTGFVPGPNFGSGGRKNPNGAAHQLPPPAARAGAAVHENGNSFLGKWQCSPKQQALVLRLVDEGQLDKREVEKYAVEHFEGKGVKELDKTQASGLIEYLFSLGTPAAFGARRLRKAA